MKRGATERETCDLNGWRVDTVLRGHERWGNGEGVWTTIRITALGERLILARCVRHERTDATGEVTRDHLCTNREVTWTLGDRDWSALSASNTRSVALGDADDVGGAQNGSEQPCHCIAAGAGGTHWPSDHNKRNEPTTNPAPNVAGSDEGEGMA